MYRITKRSLFILLAYLPIHLFALNAPVAEYRMDECYWLGGGITDVANEASILLQGEAMNGAQVDRADAMVNFSGSFNISGNDKQHIVINKDAVIDFDQNFTITLWVKPLDSLDSHLVNRYNNNGTSNTDDDKGFKLLYNDNKEQLRFIIVTSDGRSRLNLDVSLSNWSDGNWHFVTARYDGADMFLAFDDTNVTKAVTGSMVNDSAMDLFLASKPNGSRALSGYLDEVKIWDIALSDSDIVQICTNESNGKNYDGSTREAVTCDASIAANSWALVGIPADFRNPNNTKTTVADIFGDDMSGTYDTDWRVYRRDYSDSNNSSWYTYLAETDTLEFGKAYWLGSKNDSTWSENGAVGVDYNATDSACTAARCAEIDLQSVSLNFGLPDNDTNDGSGPYRYNMTGFIGRSPVNWSDCRFIIDGTAYTPSEAENAGYASKQIWQYNPGTGADANGYTTCDDTTPGSCKLEPYKGFWVELHGSTKNKTVKLLIPKE